MLSSNRKSRRGRVLLASAVLSAMPFLMPLRANAQTAQVGTVTAGSTPFLAVASASYSGGTLASVSYAIAPLGSSVTRPLSANYSANYLGASGTATSGSVAIPIFGLYAGTTNTVNITFNFTNGASFGPVAASLQTAAYTDACLSVALNPSPFNQLSRPAQSELNFDYFLLKTDCANSPEIRDVDGNLRWVGTAGSAGGVEDPALIENAIFASDDSTSLVRIDVTSGVKTPLANYAGIGVTATNQHNIDPGRNGMLLEVNTTGETEAVILEINPATGAVMNTWDMGAIISAAMTAGGDNPSGFVLGTAADWFHNNSTTYNPADNTLIVSSRENFVIAVDYDPPATGQRQIHWILGDPTKAWHGYPSLANYALSLGANTLPPIGQHGVSIDHVGNLLLFDDGLGSLTLSPSGLSRNYSAVRSFQINTAAMTATEVFTYTLADSAYAGGSVFSPICGSVYDVGGNYLVDFATANPAAAAASPNGPSTAAGNNAIIDSTLLGAGNQTSVILAGLGAVQGATQYGFIQQIGPPTATCLGWNAVPLASNVFNFNGYVNASAVTIAPGSSGTVAVAISGLSSAPATLGINGSPAVNTAVNYGVGASGAISAEFTGVTTSGATLTLSVPTSVPPSTVPYEIPVTIGSAPVGTVTVIVPQAAQTITFAPIPAQSAGTTLSLAASATSGLPVTYMSTPASICTVSGSTVSFIAAGNCTITASQSGSPTYSAAPSVSQTVTVTGNASPVSVTIAPVTLAQGVGNVFPATISGLTSAPTTLGFGGVACVNLPGCIVNLSGGGIPLNFEFVGVSATSASVVIYVTTAVPPGTYAVPITIGTTSVGSLTLTVPQLAQTITFGTIGTQTVGTPLGLAASASSGLAVSYTSTTTGVCTVSGSTATFAAAGTCTITAAQSGSSTYAAATSVSQSFTVKAAASAVSVTIAPVTLAQGTYNAFPATISGASSAPTTLGLGGVACVNIPGCTVAVGGNGVPLNFEFSGVSTTGASLGIYVSPSVPPGTYTLPITIGTTTVGSLTLTVPQLAQTITFGTIGTQTVGTPLGLAASASSGLAVSYTSTTPGVCNVSGSTATFAAAGTCTITAAQSGSSTYAAATSVSQSFTVKTAASAVSVTIAPVTLAQGTYNAFPATISGASSAPTTLGLGGVACVNIPGCLVNLSGNGVPLNFEFSGVSTTGASLGIYVSPSVPPGTYAVPITIGTTSVGSLTLTVPQLAQTITFGTIAAQKVGTPLALGASASSGLAVSYTSTPSSVCTVSGSTATFAGAGTCTITAAQAGNSTYAAATSVSQSFTVGGPSAGAFTLTPASTRVTVTPPLCVFLFCSGAVPGTDAITVASTGGFTGAVTFSISGLPAGVTATFGPASITTKGSTTLTLTPSSSAAAGKSTTLTITGTSGSQSATTTITLSY